MTNELQIWTESETFLVEFQNSTAFRIDSCCGVSGDHVTAQILLLRNNEGLIAVHYYITAVKVRRTGIMCSYLQIRYCYVISTR